MIVSFMDLTVFLLEGGADLGRGINSYPPSSGYASMSRVSIGSDNGLSPPIRRQATI